MRVGPGRRLAGRAGVRLAELAGDDMVLPDRPFGRDNRLPNLRASGLDPKIAWQSTSFEAVRGMVARGLGYTVLVQHPPLDLSHERLRPVCLPIGGPIGHSGIRFAYAARLWISLKRQALIDCCADSSPPASPSASNDE